MLVVIRKIIINKRFYVNGCQRREEVREETKKKKKKKASKAVQMPKKPFLQNIALDGEAILLQVQAFEREFKK